MSGHAPANQLRLSLPRSDRVKPERDRVSGETNIGRKSFETSSPPGPRLLNRRIRTRTYGGVGGVGVMNGRKLASFSGEKVTTQITVLETYL
jgi:hypothetical protein